MKLNGVLAAGLLGWGIAQAIKFFLYYVLNKAVRIERLIGSGGMPSSHSSMVCALAVAAGRSAGFGSALFAVTAVFGAIVMYDAMNVRLESGRHAKVLNRLMDVMQEKGTLKERSEHVGKELKEFLGHTPLEVFCGALLGILIGILTPLGTCAP